MPEYNSVDWLVASRRVEPVELHNSTASSGTKKKGGVKMKKHFAIYSISLFFLFVKFVFNNHCIE